MIENKSSQISLYYENDKQSKIRPIIGKIDYLDTKGNIVETIEYTDQQKFENQAKEGNYYGVPMLITVYSINNGSDKFIQALDPLPQGYKVERKSIVADLKSAAAKNNYKEKLFPLKHKEISR